MESPSRQAEGNIDGLEHNDDALESPSSKCDNTEAPGDGGSEQEEQAERGEF